MSKDIEIKKNLELASNFIFELKERGLISEITDESRIISILASGKKLYFGIDPTSDFLHLGHYLGLSIIKRFLNNGYRFILIIGGVTAQIGDPSFRSSERKFDFDIHENSLKICDFLYKFFSKEINKGLLEIVNNYELHNNYLLKNTPYLRERPLDVIVNFCKDVCKCVSFNYLKDGDFLKCRIEDGLTVSEFLYPLLQGWDFLRLYCDKGVCIQMGGSDQWGNILIGLKLISKSIGADSNDYLDIAGFTFPLLTDSNGQKFGKSAGNSISITDSKSTYFVYQYLRNVSDDLVERYFLFLTFISIPEIRRICRYDINLAKETLAVEVCKDIFGDEKANKLKNTSKDIFGRELILLKTADYSKLGEWYDSFPSRVRHWEDGISLSVLFREVGLVSSNSEFKRLCASGGIYVAGLDPELIKSGSYGISKSDVCWNPDSSQKEGYLLIRKGQKQMGVIKFVDIR